MADDQTQRPLRTNPLGGRATPTAGQTSGSNDPLAELARLIGQNDPFGEYGTRGTPKRPAEQAIDWRAPPSEGRPHPYDAPARVYQAPASAHAPASARDAYAVEGLARPAYNNAPPPPATDAYHSEGPVPGYNTPSVAEAYEETYEPGVPPYAAEDDDLYDEAPPPRRRLGILAIAAVFGLAVIGTAAAFGYRTLFGSQGSGPPPVIKAEAAPAKVIPDKEQKSQTAKLINDRVNEPGAQKLVSREEQPVDLKNKPAGVLGQPSGAANAAEPAMGSGVIGANPKKIHTITIRPDEPVMANAAPPGEHLPQAMPEKPAMPAETAAAPPADAAKPAAASPPPSRPAAEERSARAPARPPSTPDRVASVASANAPLSLSPGAPPPSQPRTHTATASPPPRAAAQSTASVHGYAVQISSRRNEAEAHTAIRSLQGKYGSVLSGQHVMVRRVELGAKGVYYRAMVGPLSNGDAIKLCTRLKAAGGSCFVQRI